MGRHKYIKTKPKVNCLEYYFHLFKSGLTYVAYTQYLGLTDRMVGHRLILLLLSLGLFVMWHSRDLSIVQRVRLFPVCTHLTRKHLQLINSSVTLITFYPCQPKERVFAAILAAVAKCLWLRSGAPVLNAVLLRGNHTRRGNSFETIN